MEVVLQATGSAKVVKGGAFLGSDLSQAGRDFGELSGSRNSEK